MIGWKRGSSDSPPHSPPRSPTYKRVCRGAAYDEEDDEDELTDSDADTLIIDPERCIDDSVGDDDREFEHNLAGEHHLESSSSSSDVEDEEEEAEEEAEVEGVWNGGDGDDEWVEVNVREVGIEFDNDFDGCEDVRIRFGLLLDEIDQIHQMLGDIDRADDDGYYSDEDWCVALH